MKTCVAVALLCALVALKPTMPYSADCGGWKDAGTLVTRGEYDHDGLRFTFAQSLDTRTGRYITTWRTSSGGGGSQGFDGKLAWTQDASGGWHYLNSSYARALSATQAWLNRRGWCRATGHGEGSEKFVFTPEHGIPVDVSIDDRTHLLASTRLQLDESQKLDTYSDWRDLNGIVVPFQDVVYFPGDEETDVWTTDSAVTRKASPKLSSFAPPPMPHDVTMLGSRSAVAPLDIEDDKPLVEVRLDGQGPFPFVLDTGAHILITPQTAAALGLHGVGAGHETGQGTAVRRTTFTRIRAIQIGGAVLHNQIVPIVSFGFHTLERGPRPPKAGWLGVQLFERLAVTMNPALRTVTLTPLAKAALPAGRRIPIVFNEDAPLVACRIDGYAGECMIDTGNQGDTIVEGHWAERVGLARRLSRGLDVGDGVRTSRATIQFGPFTLGHELVDYYPPAVRGSESTTTVAAILSEDVLRRYVMTLDYARYAVWLDPIPGARALPFDRTGLDADEERDGSLRISHIISGSSAADAGLRVGDTIIGINHRPAMDYSDDDLWILGTGPVGSKLTLDVKRGTAMPIIVVLRLREILR